MQQPRKGVKAPTSEDGTSPHYVSEADLFRKDVRGRLANAQAAEANLEADIAELQASLQVANSKLADVREVIIMAEGALGDTARAKQIEGQANGTRS